MTMISLVLDIIKTRYNSPTR